MKDWLLSSLVLMSLLFPACAGEETVENQEPAIDAVTGLDTNRVLISSEALEAQSKLGLIPFLEGAAMGFADSSGKVVIPAQYEEVSPFRNNLATVKVGGKYGLIDKLGNEILPPQYNSISAFASGVMWLGTEEGYYLINGEGKRVLPDAFDKAFAYSASEGRVPVEKEGKIAYFDTAGTQLTEFTFDRVGRFYQGVAPVLNIAENGWGILNKAGEMVVPPLYRKLFPFKNGLGVASLIDINQHERFGVINTQGEEVIPFVYGNISGTGAGGYFVARKYGELEAEQEMLTNKSIILDRTGKVVAELDMMLWDEFSEGLVVAEQDGKFGFVGTDGEVKIPFQFDWVCPFSEGLAWAKGDEYYGFIDHEGNFAIPPQYVSNQEYILMKKEGVLVADPETKEMFYLDPSGREYRK